MRYIGCFSLIVLLFFCCAKKRIEKEVKLEDLHINYQYLQKEIPEDIFKMCNEDVSLHKMKDKSYSTPKLHSSINGIWGPYGSACMIINKELGELENFELVRVTQVQVGYIFRYNVKVTKSIKPIKLKILINNMYGLSEFHFYRVNDDNALINLFFSE